MQAQGIAVAVGLALKAIFLAIPGTQAIAGVMYYVGHFITYAICNAIHSYIQERDQNYYIRSQTFHNSNYEGEVKLSDKLAKDRYFGDMMTDALLDSGSGTYAPVRAETDKHAYSGEVVLAPRGKSKTSLSLTLDISFKHLVLDYSRQTRGYFAYSDLDDPRFISFFYDEVVATESVTMLVSRNDKDKYMGNSIMYLEDMVHDATIENDDTHYDSIVPYMVYGDGTFVPVLQFADSEGSMPVPEFYNEYPIFLSPEQYELLDDDEYHSIYKIYDGNSDTIQLIPDYSTHALHSDIVSFDAYLCDGQSTEIPIGNYKNSDSYESFTFNSTSGEIILSPLQVYNLDCYLDNYEGADAYIVLEFFIEKYRSIDDLRDLTAGEVETIATMQSAHANILEYMYQHTIATKTQQKLSEAAYTVLVTVISTLPFAIAGAIKGFTKGIAKGLYQFPKMLISETLEELYLDPWIESYVSGYAEEHGWNTLGKSLAVSFAESSRETFGSTIATAFSSVFSTSNQASQEINSGPESQAQSVESANQLKAGRKSSVLKMISQVALSTIMLFAGFISPVATIFGTSATYIGMASVSTVKEIRYKRLLNKIIDSYSETDLQNLLGILSPSKVADPQTALFHNELSSIANKEHSLITDEQKNKEKSGSLLQKTFAWVNEHKKQIAMYAGVVLAGFLITIGINALFADSMFGSLAGASTTMGLGTIGMVKTQSGPSQFHGIIYVVTDKRTGKVYVGQTIRTLRERFAEHLRDPPNKFFRAAVNFYRNQGIGFEITQQDQTTFATKDLEFIIETIGEASSQEELNKLERKEIKERKSCVLDYFTIKDGEIIPLYGYNVQRGGTSRILRLRGQVATSYGHIQENSLKSLIQRGLFISEIAAELRAPDLIIISKIQEFWASKGIYTIDQARKAFGGNDVYISRMKYIPTEITDSNFPQAQVRLLRDLIKNGYSLSQIKMEMDVDHSTIYVMLTVLGFSTFTSARDHYGCSELFYQKCRETLIANVKRGKDHPYYVQIDEGLFISLIEQRQDY